jgi:hypothetical protein
MAIWVKTIVVDARDLDEVDRELSRQLSAFEAARDWRLTEVETVDARSTEVAGQSRQTVTIRAYFREGN